MSIQRPRGSLMKRTQLSTLTKFRSQLHAEQEQQQRPQQRTQPLQSNTNTNANTATANVNTNRNRNRNQSRNDNGNANKNANANKNGNGNRNNRARSRAAANNNNKENRNNVVRRDRNRSKSRTRNTGYKKPLTFQEMKEKYKALRQEISELNEVNARLNDENQDIKDDLDNIQQKNDFENKAKDERITALETQNINIENENNSNKQTIFNQNNQIQMKENQIQMMQSAKLQLDQQMMNLNQNIQTNKCIMDNLQQEMTMLKSKNQMMLQDCNAKQQQIQSLTQNLHNAQHENQANIQQIKSLREENMTISLKNTSLNNMNENQLRKIRELTEISEQQQQQNAFNQERMQRMQNENHGITQQRDMLQRENQSQSQTIHQQKQQIHQLQEKCVWFEDRSRKDEEIRKRLHNEIQELKGNIRVYCRVRPMAEEQKENESVYHFNNDDIEEQAITLFTPGNVSDYNGQWTDGKKYNFDFDRVFRPFSSQQHVFNEISQLVQSALDGYKVCIFAYGQTGSGKTYTMEGPPINRDEDNRGVIPRSVEKIFEHKEKLKTKGWEFKCTASFLEIYNEKIRDLLANNNNNNNNNMGFNRGGFNNFNNNEPQFQYLEIRQKKSNPNSKKTEIYVEGLTEVEVSSPSDVYPLLRLASKNRSVGKTDCNERSSRSHSVFQLYLNGSNASTRQSTSGVLNLIDLAGSERLKKSNAKGVQLKETQNINKSLSCLGDVIAALSSKKNRTHIPYRNSKLTYLLQNCFGGDAKTLMFVNLCPEKDRIDESLCSLRFAAKVNDCQIGIAKRSVGNC